MPATHYHDYIVFIIGATHFTKRMPNLKIIEICNQINYPIVLLGGNDVKKNGELIASNVPNVFNACGLTNIDESVFIISKAFKVIGFDTGLTHIAEAFTNPIVSIWGGTVPELLGVQPYKVKEVLICGIDLPCRPCSKFGLETCPKGHFNCMNKIPNFEIVNFINNAI